MLFKRLTWSSDMADEAERHSYHDQEGTLRTVYRSYALSKVVSTE